MWLARCARTPSCLISQPNRAATGDAPENTDGKWTLQDFKERLSLHATNLRIYGNKPKRVKYYSKKLKARSPKGEPVIAVWSQLPGKKSWTLILSTDLDLTSEQIIKLFSKRWKTEPMFNEIKYFFGVTKAWQRSSRSLRRWLSMLSVAYALTRLLSLIMNTKKNREALPPISWRRKSPVTAGLTRIAVQVFFRRFGFWMLCKPKYKKLILENEQILRQRTTMRQLSWLFCSYNDTFPDSFCHNWVMNKRTVRVKLETIEFQIVLFATLNWF